LQPRGPPRLAVVALAVLFMASTATQASAAGPGTFASASSAIASAYLAVNQAHSDGGNVTALVASLNVALGLYATAQAENATRPSLAATDLQNATVIAQTVASEAPAIGTQGLAARQAQEELSLGSAAAIVVIAALVYVFGDRIYRRAWLRVYSGFVVKKVG
jgi:hypothetical protein